MGGKKKKHEGEALVLDMRVVYVPAYAATDTGMLTKMADCQKLCCVHDLRTNFVEVVYHGVILMLILICA